jgi:hypothetical protein
MVTEVLSVEAVQSLARVLARQGFVSRVGQGLDGAYLRVEARTKDGSPGTFYDQPRHAAV